MDHMRAGSHHYAYLHGFASSGRSRKALHLAGALAARGLELERPELNVPSFAELTTSGALAVMDRLAEAYLGPGQRYPMREMPEGIVTHVTVHRLYGQGPWREDSRA